MKTFTKVLLTSALVLSLIGAVLLGVGVMIGGGAVVKDGTQITISNKSLEKAFTAWSEGFDLVNLCHDFDVETNRNGQDSLTVSKDELQKIDLDTASVNLYFKSSSDEKDKVTFSCEAGKEKYKLTFELTDEGTVKIRPIKRYTHLNSSQTPTVTIVCPKGFVLPKMRADVASGNLNLDGNFFIKDCDMELAAGNIDCMGVGFLKLSLENAAGNATVTLPGARELYDMDLECAVGSITVNGNNYNGFGREFKENNNGDRKLDIECAAGNITLDFPASSY